MRTCNKMKRLSIRRHQRQRYKWNWDNQPMIPSSVCLHNWSKKSQEWCSKKNIRLNKFWNKLNLMLKYKSLRLFKKVARCQNILSTLSRVRICMETFILKGNILSSSRWEKFSLKDGLALIYLPSKTKFKWTIKIKKKDLLQKYWQIL